MATGDDWHRHEVEAAVAAYRSMLISELRGVTFNKALKNREVQAMTGRSKGSVEFKHQNISAVLNFLGLPYIEGYKPRANYQALLVDVVSEVIGGDRKVHELAEELVKAGEFEDVQEKALVSWVEPPKPDKSFYAGFADEPAPIQPRPGKNYLEIEARNQKLGLAGERLVMELEHRRLWESGQRRLAERIDHVSQTKGDGLGYDIISFEDDGAERLIEVKTTQFGIMTPFFATRNEVSVSETEARRYHLYRVFGFRKNPRLFALSGALGRTCELDPCVFSATPR